MIRPLTFSSSLALTSALLLLLSGQGIALARNTIDPSKLVEVQAMEKPGQTWKEYPTRTLEALPGFQIGAPGPALDKYGGRADKTFQATGYFYPKKADGRWWLVDPEGHPFIHVGVVSVGPGALQAEPFNQKFGTKGNWAEATDQLLNENHFNGMGAWSATKEMRGTSKPLVYTLIWNFMSSFGKELKIITQQPGHAGYPNGCLPVFHPDFASFCEKHAKQLEASKNDPYLLGHFSDNELPCPDLAKYLAIDPNDPAMGSTGKACRDWFSRLKGKPGANKKDIAKGDQEAFAAFIYDRYLSVTTAAIRKADPNHLCLGSRYHTQEKKMPQVFQVSGKYLDVIAVNYYHLWTPDLKQMKMWENSSGRPCLITEWYTKGADMGFPNTGGVGWIVPTQKDRGLSYQHYTLALLESRVCVGWHWFKYQDCDSSNPKADPSNLDSNKGIVGLDYSTYDPLLSSMKQLNGELYHLTDYFDAK